MLNKFIKVVLFVAGILIFAFAFSLFYGFFVLPGVNKNVVCIQSLSHSCFLKSPICFDFPNPCSTPPLWYPARK